MSNPFKSLPLLAGKRDSEKRSLSMIRPPLALRTPQEGKFSR